MWSYVYSLFIQISFLLIIYSSFRIGNFISTEEHVKLLLSLFLTLQVYSLPAFIIMMSYDNFIQDPILEILIVTSPKKSDLLFGKLLATNVYAYIIFLGNHLLGSIILFTLFREFIIIKITLIVVLAYLIIVLFIGLSTTGLIVLSRLTSKDDVSAIFLPITLFYVIPFLLVNSLSYQVFNPIIADFSPTVWMLEFINQTVFQRDFTIDLLLLPTIIVLLLIITNRFFDRIEFE